MSLREKVIASIRGRSESPAPTNRAPRPDVRPNNASSVPRPRLPSVDSINRSSHNAAELDDDGSELSKDQIIAKLKQANAALTTKTAEMEATFMNQCNLLAEEIEKQQRATEQREEENQKLKQKVKSHESQLKEGIQIITALEKEKQFQKQTITDLKNQFFQLQRDIEDKSEEVVIHKNRMREVEQRAHELEKEKNALVYQVDETCIERDRIKAELIKYQKDSDGGNSTSIEIAYAGAAAGKKVSSPSSVHSDTSEVRQNWRQLEEKKEQLESALTLLHETQSGLATLEHKHRDLQKQFDDKLRQKSDEIKSEFQKETDELKSTLRSRDETIANLHERLETYNDDLTKAEDEVDRLHGEIDSNSHSLKRELEDTKQQLQAERDLNAELTEKYDDLSTTVEHLEKETEDLRVGDRSNHTNASKELEEQMKVKNDKISEQQSAIDKHSKELQLTKTSYENVISIMSTKLSQSEESRQQLQRDLSQKETTINELQDDISNNQKALKSVQSEVKQAIDSMKEKNDLLEVKENEIKMLQKDVAKLMATAEQQQLDNEEDMKALEESWRSAKNTVLKEKNDCETKLVEALKEIDSQRQAFKAMNVEQETWAVEKKQFVEERKEFKMRIKALNEESPRDKVLKQQITKLQKEKEDTEKNLDDARKEACAFKAQIEDLESIKSSQEKNLESYKQDVVSVNELKDKCDILQNELNTMKLEMKSEKENHAQIVASLKADGKKRGDKLRIIELSDEVDKLKSQLRQAKASDEAKHRSDAVKKVYSMAKDTQHKKEISNLEDKLNGEINELKDKLSDRDTTIAATLRSSVLQDQKINTLKEQIKKLTEQRGREPLEPDAISAHGAFDELENLRESAQNHDDTHKSLMHQIRTLKRQLAEANQSNDSALLEKQVDDYKIKVKERDGAIRSLVKASITQEQQIAALRDELIDLKHLKRQHNESNGFKGPSWKEVESLQQESEIFAGQIIEQDEEIENLRRRLDDAEVHSTENEQLRNLINDLREQLDEQYHMRDEENANKRTMSEAMKMELEEERQKREEIRNRMNKELEVERNKRERAELEMENMQSNFGRTEKQDMNIIKIQEELDEVEETNQKLQNEIRDLRRKLRSSQLEAEKVTDLEIELEQLKKSKPQSSNPDDLHIMKEKLQSKEEECKKVEETCKKLEGVISIWKEEKDKLSDEFSQKQTEMHRTEQTLRDQLSNVEAKLKSVQERETRLKGELEAHRALREVSIKEKENSASEASQDIAMYQMKMKELEEDRDTQNDLIVSLTEEVKKLRSTQIHEADTESTEIIAALTAEVKKLRSENLSKDFDDGSSDIITALTEEVKKLRNDKGSDNSDDIIAALTQEVKRLHLIVKKQNNNSDSNEIERVIRSEIEQEMQSIRSQKDFLAKENMNLQAKLEDLESGKIIATLKKQVDEAEKGRTLFEKTMISTYERKLSLMQMNKDLTIDGLRKELTQSKETLKEIESDLLNKIRSLDSEKNELEAELKAKMQHKNAKIKFLEQTLSAHEQVAGHMKDELDQLQNGMESVSVNRRAELEELQEELMTVQSKAAKYEREIAGLKMKLDDQKAHYKNEISKLHYQMEEIQMEDMDSPSIRQIAEKNRMAVNEMAKQVEALRAKVSSLQMENFDLREKMDKDETSSRTSKNDKWRNSALQEQVQVLTRRLRELEGDDSSLLSSSSARRSKRSSINSSSTRRLPLTPRGGGSSSRRVLGGYGDDISTHTENTC